MLLNNVHKDVKRLCISDDTTMAEVGRRSGISSATMLKVFKSSIVNKTLIKFLEYLGYDIKIEYIPRMVMYNETPWIYDADHNKICPNCHKRILVTDAAYKTMRVCSCGYSIEIEEI